MGEARVLYVDLAGLERGARPAVGARRFEGSWATLASWGGSALGLACLHEEVAAGREGALVIAVGEAVRAGLPTAARAAVLARAPLSGRYAEGHVGGELGARLAGVADALVLTNRCARSGAVLVLEEDGECRLLERPDLLGGSPAETARTLEGELGPCAVLTIGQGGERGLPFASLAAGHAPPSFVGRGGLGAVFGALGLKSLVVRARPAARVTTPAAGAALVERLSASPRLAARAAGGTLELFEAWAARGELAPEIGKEIASEAEERADARHGCRGCPTPCGWVFERSDGVRQGARFGASHALGVALGLERLDDALHLLGVCDHLGIDAKEVGAVLALQCVSEERHPAGGRSARGDRAALLERIEALVRDEQAPGRKGCAALARELGMAAEVPVSRGQAVRPERSRAALLGQCVASGGSDPMRSFPFLLESAERARLEGFLAPLPIPDGALDPDSGVAKGRLVYWHENLISAVDLSGFCAFSAAGLLADGLVDVDQLASWILPEALRAPGDAAWAGCAPGTRLLAAGANLVLARRALNGLLADRAQEDRLGAFDEDPDRPPFARAWLDEPGMLAEYRALRGLDGRGRPSPEAEAGLGTPSVLGFGRAVLEEKPTHVKSSLAAGPRSPGTVTLRASGRLAEVLGACRRLEASLPATVKEVLECAAGTDAAARVQLFQGECLIPAVWREGQRLQPDESVGPDDVLELVTAIAGG